MYFSIAALAFLADCTMASQSIRGRRLSYSKISGYEPESQVTDHAAIDLDQATIETLLSKQTEESFGQAKAVYEKGGNSKSVAEVTIAGGATTQLNSGTLVTGTSVAGQQITGKVKDTVTVGVSQLRIQYSTTDVQETYVGCRVGAQPADMIMTDGCFATTGNLTIGSGVVEYSYDVNTGNVNDRTIQGFSTSAKTKMLDNSASCPGCPYAEFNKYYTYYGDHDYADNFIKAAFDGTRATFSNGLGSADFSQYGLIGREQIAKKGTAYMSIYMYVIRELEDAIDDCKSECINCNDDPVHAWDEAVAFYSGSLEGPSGSDEGKLGYRLAEKRCANFKTCGPNGDSLEGTSKVNYDMFSQFALGQNDLLMGNCPALRPTVDRITDLMAVPLIQGTIRYAYKVDKLQGVEKEKAEGAVFAAAVLPRVHACSPEDAETIYNNMKVGASSTSFSAVKTAFENNYECMNIDCATVGGLYNDASGEYYAGAGLCEDKSTSESSSSDDTLAIALGVTFGVVALIVCGVLFHMVRKEKQGNPLFAPTKTPHPNEMS